MQTTGRWHLGPWLDVHHGPRCGAEQEDSSPIPTDVCERDDLIGTRIQISSEIGNPSQKFLGKPARLSVLVRGVATFSTWYNPESMVNGLGDGLRRRTGAN